MTLYDFCIEKNSEDLLREYDYEKNAKSPYEVEYNSDEVVYWVCKRNHSFKQKISDRTLRKYKCPECKKLGGQSYSEKIICFYVKRYFPDTLENIRPDWMEGKELDMFIPSLNIAIEYDGVFYHKDSDNDISKNLLCLRNGVKLIRIRERGLPVIDYCMNISLKGNGHYALKKVLQVLLPFLGISKAPIDITKDCYEIRKEFFFRQNKNNLRSYCQDHNYSLLLNWNYQKNTIRPSEVFASCDEIVFFKDKDGKEWKQSIQSYLKEGALYES